MRISTSKSTKTFALMTTIFLMASLMLTFIPSVIGRSASDPTSGINWNGFSDHYDPATMGSWPQHDPTSPNIPVAALIYPDYHPVLFQNTHMTPMPILAPGLVL
jgi:hypothetical protein